MSDTPEKTPLLGVDWLRAVAGALAAVSTTVLLSTLGAAGTLLGAALGSIAATVATALYSQGLDRSRSRVRELSVLRTGSVPLRGPADEPYDVAGPTGGPEAPTGAAEPGWRERLRRLGWRRLLVAALAMFVLVVAVVTVFELVAGRTLASTVRGESGGGTTISHVTRSGGGGSPSPTPPEGGASPSEAPGTATSTPTPSATPSEEPSAAPSDEPSAAPSEGATPLETPQPTLGTTPSIPASPDAQIGQ